MPDLSLIPIFLKELLLPNHVTKRMPEQMVMEDQPSIDAYTSAATAQSMYYLYHIAHVCSVLGSLKKDSLIIDLGCGPATILSEMARLNPHLKFVGYELSEGMIAKGNKLIADMKLKNLTLKKGDMTNLNDLPEESVDGVICIFALHQLPEFTLVEKTFREIKRVLKPENGAIYISDFARLKSPQSIEFFLKADSGDQTQNEHLQKDFRNSLNAAYTFKELRNLSKQYLPTDVEVLSTFIIRLLIFMKTKSYPLSTEQKEQLGQMSQNLFPGHDEFLKDFNQFAKMGGMPDLFKGLT